MKKLLMVFLLFSLLFSTSCKKGAAARQSEDKSLIVATIHPYALLIKQMVGDGIEVKSLIPPNASPHTWSPQPSDLKDLYKAELVVSNGMGLELLLGQALADISPKHLVVAELLKDMVELDSLNQIRKQQLAQSHADVEDLEHSENDEPHHHHHHPGADPHLWTAPVMLQKLSTKLKNELLLLFPDYAPVINHNHDQIQKELAEADSKILSERRQYQAPAILTYHNSFHYFTQAYEILYAGWVQSSPGQEPAARELARLGESIKKHGIKSIFIEPQQNPKSAEVLAKEYRLQLETLDPLGSTIPVETISELILANWEIMKKSF